MTLPKKRATPAALFKLIMFVVIKNCNQPPVESDRYASLA